MPKGSAIKCVTNYCQPGQAKAGVSCFKSSRCVFVELLNLFPSRSSTQNWSSEGWDRANWFNTGTNWERANWFKIGKLDQVEVLILSNKALESP